MSRRPDYKFSRPDIPIEYHGYYIEIPRTYTAEENGLKYTVDFFQDKYKFGSIAQVRITAENNSDAAAEYIYEGVSCYVKRSDGKIKYFDSIYEKDILGKIDSALDMRCLEVGEKAKFEMVMGVSDEFFVSSDDTTYELLLNLPGVGAVTLDIQVKSK